MSINTPYKRYAGHLDELTPSCVSGWISDQNVPERTPDLYVKTNKRLYKIIPTIHRGDVAAIFGGNGMRGFKFCLNKQQKRSERIIGAFFQDGYPIPPQSPDDGFQATNEEKRYFIHIQKTAGTSLRAALMKAYKQDELLLVYPDAPGISAAQASNIPYEQLQRIELVYGHFFLGQLGVTPFKPRYYTLLRDPRERVRSQIQHIARSTNLSAKQVMQNHLRENRYEELDNYYLRVISGHSSMTVPVGTVGETLLKGEKLFDLACRRANTYFAAIGILEDCNVVAWTKEHLEINIDDIGRENSATEEKSWFSQDPDFAKIMEMNKYDVEFYRYIREENAKQLSHSTSN